MPIFTCNKIFVSDSQPSNTIPNKFWFDLSSSRLKYYTGTAWVPVELNASSIDVASGSSSTDLQTLLSSGELNTTSQTIIGAINEVNADASELKLSKINKGELFFYANSLASQTNSITSLPFSVCATFDKADFDAISSDNPEYLFTNTANENANATSGAYAVLKGTDGKTRLYVYKTNSLSSRIVEFDIANLLKAGQNTIIFTASLQDNGVPYLKCFLNGNLVASRNNTAAWTDGVMTPDTNFAWHQRNWLNPGGSSYVSQNNMRYSRLKAFNFDMSAADAPYTVADYQNGVDVPPALRGAWFASPSAGGMTAADYAGADNEIDSATGYIVSTCLNLSSSNSLAIVVLDHALVEGETIVIQTGDRYAVADGSTLTNLQFCENLRIFDNSINTVANIQLGGVAKNTTITYTVPAAAAGRKRIGIQFPKAVALSSRVDYFQISFAHNGTLLSLADYTVKSGTTQTILDASGNANDATITGNVLGTNDIEIVKLKSNFTEGLASDSVVVKTVNSLSPTSGAITLKSQNISLTSNITVNGTTTSNVQTCLSALNSEKVNTPIVGSLSSLDTTDKTSVVNAINEVNAKLLASIPEPITGVFTASSTSLVSLITDSTKANIQGKVLISPNINNVGAIYVGQSVTDKANAFPLYPNQIVSFSFTDITNFKCAVDVLGDSFNYVIEFGVLNAAVTPAEGLIMVGTNGGQYQLIPSGEAGSETFTITRIS